MQVEGSDVGCGACFFCIFVSSYANADKANRELGWSADTPIADVLLSAWKWQQNLMK